MQKVIFNNGNSAFFETLKRKVDDYFKANNIRETGNIRLYYKTILLLLSLLSLYVILVFFTPSVWISLLLCCLMGFTLAAIGFNTMHDAAHGSFSSKTWVNEMLAHSLNVMGGDVFLWKAKHNLFHHSFTNIEGMDEDIDIKPWIITNEIYLLGSIIRYYLFIMGLCARFSKIFFRKNRRQQIQKNESIRPFHILVYKNYVCCFVFGFTYL